MVAVEVHIAPGWTVNPPIGLDRIFRSVGTGPIECGGLLIGITSSSPCNHQLLVTHIVLFFFFSFSAFFLAFSSFFKLAAAAFALAFLAFALSFSSFLLSLAFFPDFGSVVLSPGPASCSHRGRGRVEVFSSEARNVLLTYQCSQWLIFSGMFWKVRSQQR